MYYGSQYCGGCKYNRDCYSLNYDFYSGRVTGNECIIVRKNFQKIYEKENLKGENNG